MPAKTIELKRAAGDKRAEAGTKLKELKERVQRQIDGKLAEGETKLSAEEISQRRAEIEALNNEAKEIEGLDTLEGLMSRAATQPDDVDGKARDILRGNDGDERRGRDYPISDEQKRARAFKGMGRFLRTVRATSGPSDVIDLDPLTEAEVKELAFSWHQATLFTKGERFHKEFNVNIPQGSLELAKKTLVGDNTGSAGRGDFLVPTEPMAELLRVMSEQQQFVSRARRVPMSRRTISFPRLQQNAVADTRPMFGFAAVTKIGEGASKPVREPTFEQLILTAFKYAAYVEASDELISDSIVPTPPILIELLTSAIAYEFDRDGMRGVGGTTEPAGFIDHASAWTQRRTTAGSVTLGDIFGLEERFFGSNGIYLHHPSVITKLGQIAVGNVIAWNRDISGPIPGTLMGRPMVRTVKLPNLGAKGDINLVDPGYYLVGDLQAITVANSIHFQFQNDVTAWRATFRAAGTPWPAGLFSAESTGAAFTFRMSPFCVLDLVTAS